MEHLYIILNKEAHEALLKSIFGCNPLKFVESVAIYCPESPSKNRVVDWRCCLLRDPKGQFVRENLLDEFVGHTTILY